MAQSVCPVVSAEDRVRLETIVADRNLPRKHVARPRPVLLSADRLGVAAIARQAGIGRPAVWRWQRRYAEAGVDGLPRDRTRKPGKAPLDDALVRRIVADLRRAARGDHPLDAGDGRGGGGLLRSVQVKPYDRIWTNLLKSVPAAVDGRRLPPGPSAGPRPANRPSPGPARRRASPRPRGRRGAARSPGEPSGPQRPAASPSRRVSRGLSLAAGAFGRVSSAIVASRPAQPAACGFGFQMSRWRRHTPSCPRRQTTTYLTETGGAPLARGFRVALPTS